MTRNIVEMGEEMRMRLEMIVLDRDAKGALVFAGELLSRIKQSENAGMKNHLDM
jgi:hypothetical protein